MSWIKDANKLGEYLGTYFGFRLYCSLQPFHSERIVDRDGEQYRETTHHPGWYIAINRNDFGFEGESKTEIIFNCQVAQMNSKYENQEEANSSAPIH